MSSSGPDPWGSPPPFRPGPGYDPGWGPPGPPLRTGFDGMAIAAFIIAFFIWPVGLILGILALRRVNRTGRRGRGLAIAAIVLSLISLVLVIRVVASGHLHASSGALARPAAVSVHQR